MGQFFYSFGFLLLFGSLGMLFAQAVKRRPFRQYLVAMVAGLALLAIGMVVP